MTNDTGTDERRINFFLIDNAIVDDLELAPFTGWLYVVIVRHINQATKIAFPSITTLAKKSGMKRPTVIAHLKRLTEAGLIVIEQTIRADGGQGVNHYKLVNLTAPPSKSPLPPPVNEVNPNNTNSKKTLTDIAFPLETPPARDGEGISPKTKSNSNLGDAGQEFADKNSAPADIFPIGDDGMWELPVVDGQRLTYENPPKYDEPGKTIPVPIDDSIPLADKIAAAKTDNEIDPTDLSKRPWMLLGGAMWHKHKHFSAIPYDVARLDPFIRLGLVRALKRRLKYALTDQGFEWVNANIPAHYRKDCVDAHENNQRRAKESASRKESRRLEPPKPKGRQHVYAQIEPIYNAINECWGGGKLLTPEHNARCNIARQVLEVGGTPDEIRAIYHLGIAEKWGTFTPYTILKHLSSVRKQQSDNNETGKRFEPLPTPPPLDPSVGIAYTKQENE